MVTSFLHCSLRVAFLIGLLSIAGLEAQDKRFLSPSGDGVSTSLGPAATGGEPQNVPPAHSLVSKRENPLLKPPRDYGGRGITVGTRLTSLGAGAEFALPVASKMDLRFSVSGLNFSYPWNEDGVDYNAKVNLRSGIVQADLMPRQGNFRISPGLMIYNQNTVKADVVVAAGSEFDLGDGSYYSSPTDPITAHAVIRLGYNLAPVITFGWRNILPHAGRRFSMPLEIGGAYIDKPTVTLNVSGSGCSSEGCAQISSEPQGVADIEAERQKLIKELSPLRAIPIITLGFNYRFGRL